MSLSLFLDRGPIAFTEKRTVTQHNISIPQATTQEHEDFVLESEKFLTIIHAHDHAVRFTKAAKTTKME